MTTAKRQIPTQNPLGVASWYDTSGVLFPELSGYGGHVYPSLGSQSAGGAAQVVGGQLLNTMVPFREEHSGQTNPFGSFFPPDDSCLEPVLQQGVIDPQLSQLPDSSLGDSMGWGLGSESMVPDLDASGAHNAYLRGTDADWTVQKLDEGSHFEDWMRQHDSFGGY